MKRTLGLLFCALLVTGCDETTTKNPASGAAVSPVAEEKKVEAVAEPNRSLAEPLFGDVGLGFEHNVLMDNEQQIAEIKQRTLMLESVGLPLPDALAKLEGDLVSAGFTLRDSQDVQGSLIRNYHRNGDLSQTGGQVININAGAYEQEQSGRTGTLNLTLKHNAGQ
jgi:hypothetical protein